jgi:hypothetical protein
LTFIRAYYITFIPIKDRIEHLLGEIGILMKGHLDKRDFDSVTQLAPLLSRVQQLQKRAAELDGEVSEIETSLKAMNGKITSERVAELVPRSVGKEEDGAERGRAGPQTLRIEIDWKANGKQREREIILQPIAGDGMEKFLSRLVEELGEDAIQKLRRVRVNRGPLLSRSPETDFLNQTQGKVYAHKRLRGTDYFVLTHSQTSQKADDLGRICRVVGLVPGSVQIRVVDRADCYADLINNF